VARLAVDRLEGASAPPGDELLPARGGDDPFGALRPRDPGAEADRERQGQRDDRRRAPHQPEDGQEPHLEHPDEAPDRQPDPGCGLRSALRPRLAGRATAGDPSPLFSTAPPAKPARLQTASQATPLARLDRAGANRGGVPAAEAAELVAERAEIAFLALDLPQEGGQLAAGVGVAAPDRRRQGADLLLEPAALGFERERAGVAVGERPLQARGVVGA